MTAIALFRMGAGLVLLAACSANDGTPIEELRARSASGDSGGGGQSSFSGSDSGGKASGGSNSGGSSSGGSSSGGSNSGGSNSGGSSSGGKTSAGSAGMTAGGGGSGGGGTAGSSTSGGQPGTGGAAPGSCGNLIDDFEDHDGFGCVGNGRNGQWFGYNNGGTATPVGNAILPTDTCPARAGSNFCMRFAGVDTLLAGIGTSIARVGDQAIDYDATAFTGVEFYATASPALAISFEIQTADTDLVMYGGTCTANCASNKHAFSAETTWQKVRVPFQSMTGGSSPLNPAKIRSINFVEMGGFEFYIDDVAFY